MSQLKEKEVEKSTGPEYPKIAYPIKSVTLHAAVIIDGKTEANIRKEKVPSLKTMGWAANGFFVLIGNTVHILPSAAVKDSIA